MPEFKKILIIGGTGFIGSYLVDNLAKRTDLELDIVYNGDLNDEDKLPNIKYHNIDLSNDFNENTINLINSSDCIVSLAIPIPNLIGNLASNIKSDGPKKIVYTSTILVYSDSDQPHIETDIPNPETEYEKNKVKEEKILENFSQNDQTKVCIARLGNVYGDVKNRGLINYIILALKNNSTLKINGQGEHRRNYIFVQDVANLLEFLIFNVQKLKFEIYNICSRKDYTINEIVSSVEKIFSKKINKEYGDLIEEKLNVVGENKKIIDKSGYQLEYDLVSGLDKAYHNYSIKK